MFGAYIGFQFVGTLYLQSRARAGRRSRRRSRSCPGGLLVAFGSPAAGAARRPLRHRPDHRWRARSSFLIGYALFLRIGESFSYAGLFLPTMLLIGVGFALSFPAFNMQATAGIANHEQGLASGLVNTSLQVGGAIGLAIVDRGDQRQHAAARRRAAALLDGFQPAIAVVTAISAHRAGRRPRGHGAWGGAPAPARSWRSPRRPSAAPRSRRRSARRA